MTREDGFCHRAEERDDIEKTADDMFRDLGYEPYGDAGRMYKKEDEEMYERIITYIEFTFYVDCEPEVVKKIRYENSLVKAYLTFSEIKAAVKKIEELEGKNGTDRKGHQPAVAGGAETDPAQSGEAAAAAGDTKDELK